MSMYKCLLPCKIGEGWTVPGQVIDISDKGTIKHLEKNNAIVATKENRGLTPAEELQKVKPVNAAIAKILVDNGVTTIDKLAAYTVEQLLELGLDKKVSEKIFSSFE